MSAVKFLLWILSVIPSRKYTVAYCMMRFTLSIFFYASIKTFLIYSRSVNSKNCFKFAKIDFGKKTERFVSRFSKAMF